MKSSTYLQRSLGTKIGAAPEPANVTPGIARYLERVRDAADVDTGDGYRAAYGPAAQENTIQ